MRCRVTLLAFLILTSGVDGQGNRKDEIERGRIKAIDLDARLLTLAAADKDRQLALTEQTRVLGSTGRTLRDRLQGFNVGVEIFFVSDRKDKETAIALKLVGPALAKRSVELSKLKPLSEVADYEGHKGGFYPSGNERPAAHEAAGLALAKQVRPLDASGKQSDNGRIVLLSVGMSNTSQASQGFQRALASARGVNPRFLFVNGAQGGMTAAAIQDPSDGRTGTRYWSVVEERLKAAGVTAAQVQVVWIKQADAGPSQGFPGYAKRLQEELARIVQILPERFPNVKLCYLSSRTYGGYATTPLNPEPYAFESAYSVKWLIEQQLNGEAALNFDPQAGSRKAPWLSWGPYLWAAGTTRRSDGFYYERSDFVDDGTHLSPTGQQKVGQLLLDFFQRDATARSWFMSAP